MDSWDVLDRYFSDSAAPFTTHHIASYREFLRKHIPTTIASYNPIVMIKTDEDGAEQLKVELFVGGEPTDEPGALPTAIYLDRPTIYDSDGSPVLLTPQEARLRGITYQTNLSADVAVRFTNEAGSQSVKRFPRVLIGSLPIMVQSDSCVLHGQGMQALRELGESALDPGGYFIIDGGEKVVISQERLTTNRLFISPIKDDQNFSFKASIRCAAETGETALVPRTLQMFLVKNPTAVSDPKLGAVGSPAPVDLAAATADGSDAATILATQDVTQAFAHMKGAILVSVPAIRGKVHLATLFRALGVESDHDILTHILGSLGDLPDSAREAYLAFLRPSIAVPHYSAETGKADDYGVFTQADALEQLRHRTFYKTVLHVKTILAGEVLPQITGPFSVKARYLGQLVAEFMRTVLGVQPPSDRDSYLFKRVSTSGILLAELFQSAYNTFRKNARNTLDREFNYGIWRHTGAIQELVNSNNLNKLFDAVAVSEIFQKSMKGAWGQQTGDPDTAIIQDLSRVSYIGTLSHLRRCDLPMDRSIKLTGPHRLHTQQWGIMCPFESPDGASVGLLKNLALLAHVTFGTDAAPVRAALRDLGVVPAHLTSPAATAAMNGDATRVYVNGDLYGITRDPVQLVTRLRLLRRNGLVNPFVSVSWAIKTHDIRIMTDAGRCARPLFIGGPDAVRERLAKMPRPIPISAPASAGRPKGLWFDMLLGTRLNKDLRTEDVYYRGGYDTPDEPMDDAFFASLEATAGLLEFVDVEEANNALIAMSADPDVKPGGGPRVGALAGADKRYTHTEIQLVTLFSVVTNNIPLLNQNFAPRNTFFGSQSRQAIGVHATNFSRRFDTVSYLLHYPQKALVTTRVSQYVGNDRMPNGFNAIVAVATYTGFNQEDSIILNRSAVDRGLFQISKFKTIGAAEKIISEHDKLVFANPIALRDNAGKAVSGVAHASYGALNDAGFVAEGAYIAPGQKAAVIGMVHMRDDVSEERHGVLAERKVQTHYTDASKYTDLQHYGTVDKVYVGTRGVGINSHRICKIRFRSVRRPELGDKTCCYDAATEVLTERGWLRWADLAETDKVASLRAGKTLEYATPKRVFSFQHDGKMYTLQTASGSLDLCVTPNHRLLVSESAGPDSELFLVEAKNTECTRLYHRKNAAASATPETGAPTAAGSAALRELASVHSRSNIADGLPEWVWSLCMDDAARLLEAFCDASASLADPAQPATSPCILTSYRPLADDLQRLALHAGFSATVSGPPPTYASATDGSGSAGDSPRGPFAVTVHLSGEDNSPLVDHDAAIASGELRWTDYTGPVYCCETPDGNGTVYVRRNGVAAWCGNSRFAQKGVFGMILPEKDMPFSKDGIVPDLIINPHAFPSRMTIAHLVECVFAKVCAIQGQIGDGTVFMPFDTDAVYDALAAGPGNFSRHGDEVLYNGRTGEQIQTEIFMGPNFYLRLKHMVADKVQARSFGAHDQLTRQPTEGRAKGGGLRIGEMERDVLISHGASAFISESMTKKSDGYVWSVCRHCGTAAGAPRAIAPRAPTTDPSARSCRYCGDSDVVTVSTPYAFKLLAQECEAMGVQVRMGPDALTLPRGAAEDDDSDHEDGAMEGGECPTASAMQFGMLQFGLMNKANECDEGEDSDDGSKGGEPDDRYPEDADDADDDADDADDADYAEYAAADDEATEEDTGAAAAEEAEEAFGFSGADEDEEGAEDGEDSDDKKGAIGFNFSAGGGSRGLRAPSPITLKDMDLSMSVPGGSGPAPASASSLLGDLATLGSMGPSADAGGAAAAESESAASQIKTIVLKSSRRAEDAPAAPGARGDSDDGDYDGDGGDDGDDDFFA